MKANQVNAVLYIYIEIIEGGINYSLCVNRDSHPLFTLSKQMHYSMIRGRCESEQPATNEDVTRG